MALADNPSRERILERVRAAVASPAHRQPAPGAQAGGQIFPPVGDLLERFRAECAGNYTECIVTSETAGSWAAIEGVLASLPPGEIFLQDAPGLRRMSQNWQNGRNLRWSSEGGPRESSQATLTLAETLVAATGSILVSASCGGRGASVVAPCHIVLANLDQLVPDLETALARVQESGAVAHNSFLGLITGSSRTADIEKILVMGAHGPRRLVVVVETGPSR